MPNTRAIETSKGIIRIPFPLTLFAASVPGACKNSGCQISWLIQFAGKNNLRVGQLDAPAERGLGSSKQK